MIASLAGGPWGAIGCDSGADGANAGASGSGGTPTTSAGGASGKGGAAGRAGTSGGGGASGATTGGGGAGGVTGSGGGVTDSGVGKDGAGNAGDADSGRGGSGGGPTVDSGGGGGSGGTGAADSGRDANGGADSMDSGPDGNDGAGNGGAGTAGSAGTAGTGSGEAGPSDGDGSSSDEGDADGGPIAAGVRWIGRVDTSDSAGGRFAWSGTGFAARFTGTSVGVNLQNDGAYFFQAVVDGAKSTRFQVTQGQATVTVVSGLASGDHTLELYRETEASYGVSQLLGITEATLLAPPADPARRIEFVGDSMTAGYGNLGSEPHPNYGNPSPCTFSFATESAYLSYGAVAARALSAEASIIAVSGWGVYRSNTSDMNEVLPRVYSNTLGLATSPVWDFQIQPQAVVINLGENDFGPGDPGSNYTTALGAFIDTVRTKYPAAWIFCAIGSMFDNTQYALAMTYVQSAVTSRGGDAGKVALVDLGSQDALQGTGCSWHPNVAEDQRMADVLVPVVRQKLGW